MFVILKNINVLLIFTKTVIVDYLRPTLKFLVDIFFLYIFDLKLLL